MALEAGEVSYHSPLTTHKNFCKEAPCNGLDRQALVRQSHSRAPTVGAEAAIFLGASQVIEDDSHGFI